MWLFLSLDFTPLSLSGVGVDVSYSCFGCCRKIRDCFRLQDPGANEYLVFQNNSGFYLNAYPLVHLKYL